MCENEQKPELEPEPWKPRSSELEPEPCSWKQQFRSYVIFTQGPQPWLHSCYIPFKSVSVDRRSLISTIETIASVIKYVLRFIPVFCIW